MRGIFISLVGAATVAASIAVTAGQDAPPDKGEQIMNASCTACHDLRFIQVQAMDKDGWTNSVDHDDSTRRGRPEG